jgi:hypothetical protein
LSSTASTCLLAPIAKRISVAVGESEIILVGFLLILAWKSADVITSGYLLAAFVGVENKMVLLIMNVANIALIKALVRSNFFNSVVPLKKRVSRKRRNSPK